MTLVLIALAVGTAVGLTRGGRPRVLLSMPLVRLRLLGSALGAQVLAVLSGYAGGLPADLAAAALSAAAVGFLALFGWLNRRVHGVALVAAGAVLTRLGDLRETATWLVPAWLGDVVPVAFPPRPEVVSPGDVVLAAGLGLLVAAGLGSRADRAGAGTAGAGERATLGAETEPAPVAGR